jgi:hypothetical protein
MTLDYRPDQYGRKDGTSVSLPKLRNLRGYANKQSLSAQELMEDSNFCEPSPGSDFYVSTILQRRWICRDTIGVAEYTIASYYAETFCSLSTLF